MSTEQQTRVVAQNARCCAYIPATSNIRTLPLSIDELVIASLSSNRCLTKLLPQRHTVPATTRPASTSFHVLQSHNKTIPGPPSHPTGIGGQFPALAHISFKAVPCYGLHLLSPPRHRWDSSPTITNTCAQLPRRLFIDKQDQTVSFALTFKIALFCPQRQITSRLSEITNLSARCFQGF